MKISSSRYLKWRNSDWLKGYLERQLYRTNRCRARWQKLRTTKCLAYLSNNIHNPCHFYSPRVASEQLAQRSGPRGPVKKGSIPAEPFSNNPDVSEAPMAAEPREGRRGLKAATAWRVSPEKRAELFIELQGGDELQTITRACTCAMMDLDWTIAAENRAKSRIYGSARDDLPSYLHRHLRLESHRRGQQLDAAAFSAKAELCNEVELLRTYEELMLSQTAQSSLVNY